MISNVLSDLKSDPGLIALINGRVYRTALPDNPVYPLILFDVQKEIQNTLGGESSLQRYVFDYIVMGASYVECKAIYNALNIALNSGTDYAHTMLNSDDGTFNDEVEQYVINAQSSVWGEEKMVALTAQNSVLKLGQGDGPPETFTAIGEVIGVSGLGGGGATEIDVTNLSSTGKEFILGLKDEGSITVSMNLDTGDTQQTALRTARDSGAVKNFELDLTDSSPTTISFSAYVKSFALDLAVDSKIGLEVELRITGAATWA